MNTFKIFLKAMKAVFFWKNTVIKKVREMRKFFTAPDPAKIDAPRLAMEGADAYELLVLSQHVYQDNNSYFSTNRIPRDWIETDPEALAQGIVLKDDNSGFKSLLYKNLLTGDYVYAIAGIDKFSIRDWFTNIKNSLGLKTEQYYRAKMNTLILAEAIKKEGRILQLTGHSLGGGLASFAATVAKVPAVTFNASGVTSEILAESDRTLIDASQYVLAYFLRGEYLNSTRDKKLLTYLVPDAIGSQVEVPYGCRGVDHFIQKIFPFWATLATASRHGNMKAMAKGLLKLKVPKKLVKI